MMITTILPPSVVAAGELAARTSLWAVTTDTEEKHFYPTLPNGKTIRVTHRIDVIGCHHLPSGKMVQFTKKKTNWYDSRKEAPRLRKRAWHTAPEPVPSDWKAPAVSRSEVISEVARMGGGDRAAAIVAAAIA